MSQGRIAIIGASQSEPHTSDVNRDYIYIYIYTHTCIYIPVTMQATNVDQLYCFSISCFYKLFSFCIKRFNVAYNFSVVLKEEVMDSSSTSKRPCTLQSKEGKLQWRRERAHRASETAAEREQQLRMRRERDRAKRELAANIINFTLCFKANNIAIASAKARPTDVQTSSLVTHNCTTTISIKQVQECLCRYGIGKWLLRLDQC